MTDKELKRLSRSELLEMLLAQSRNVEKLQAEITDLRAQVEDRRILLEKTGNVAEASVELCGVLDAAQKAADLYTENMRRRADEKLADTEAFIRSIAEKMVDLGREVPELQELLILTSEMRERN